VEALIEESEAAIEETEAAEAGPDATEAFVEAAGKTPKRRNMVNLGFSFLCKIID